MNTDVTTITFRFTSTDGFPKNWNVQVGKKYAALVKTSNAHGMSVIFIDDYGQLIDTIFAHSYFDGSLMMC